MSVSLACFGCDGGNGLAGRSLESELVLIRDNQERKGQGMIRDGRI